MAKRATKMKSLHYVEAAAAKVLGYKTWEEAVLNYPISEDLLKTFTLQFSTKKSSLEPP